MVSTEPSIGGDPEFFIFNKRKIISADKVLPDKHNKAHTMNARGMYFFDGVQAEINPNPSGCRETFGGNVADCIKGVLTEAQKKFKNVNVAPLASVPITLDDIKGCDNECFRFGCSPDCNIYADKRMKYPDGKKFMTRFSGGHIHIGFGDVKYMQKMFSNPQLMMDLIKLLDAIPGILNVAMSDGQDEVIRRKYYGKAGTYRIQTHGLEYRTLSPFWIVSSPMCSLITGLARDCFTLVYSGKYKSFLKSIGMKNVRSIIDTHDVNKARRYYRDFIKPFYTSGEGSDISNSPMTGEPEVLDVVDLMVSKGYSYLFHPYKMKYYWNLGDRHLRTDDNIVTYGIEHFSVDYVCKEENYYNLQAINKLKV